MLLARIEIPTTGCHRGVHKPTPKSSSTPTGTPSYLAVADPFDPDAMTTIASTRPIPAENAMLWAPCRPRVVLGMAHNAGPADRLLPPQAFHKSPYW